MTMSPKKQCQRCARRIEPDETHCLAHRVGTSGVAFEGLYLSRTGSRTRLSGEAEVPTRPCLHHSILAPATVRALELASIQDFEARVVDGVIEFDPGPVPRLRWRRGMLDWLDARGFVERRHISSCFPVGAFAPRVHPLVPRPEVYPRWIRSVIENEAARRLDIELFFAELDDPGS